MGKVTETFELFGKSYTLETGELAKQAGGAVVVRQGDTHGARHRHGQQGSRRISTSSR